ncbi:hypothetical protein [Candidatus Korobacter versatilis]|nr:hypothetical protein [Candidatus Koribacter versatilis]
MSLGYDSAMQSSSVQSHVFAQYSGAFGAIITVAVWLLSLKPIGIVPNLFGYTPAWMFGLLLLAVISGLLAAFRSRIWWLSVVASALSAVVMLIQNNS